MIRKATVADIENILLVTKACAKVMSQNGIHQWNEHYPNAAAFEKDISRGELYVFTNNDDIIGSIVISTFMDHEYEPIEWLTKNDYNLYIHRLSVHPEHQGRGYAQQLMDFAENHGKEYGYMSIRLDTFSQNTKNQNFYECRGYKRLGSIYFPKQSVHPFYCYEYVL